MTPQRPFHRWAPYLIEAVLLAAFMISALSVTTLLEHPDSPVRQAIANATIRRLITGLAMGLTAAAIIYSPWGQRSGAHINPSITLTYLRLGKISRQDAAGYVLAQFGGALVGVAVASVMLGGRAATRDVNYAATLPGPAGTLAAFLAESLISCGMMTMVLIVSNTRRFAHYTGIAAAGLVATYITIEAPISGMSMNPARSLAPAIASGTLPIVWIYFVAPVIGMLTAAEMYARRFGVAAVRCAKLHHGRGACHFHCSFDSLGRGGAAAPHTAESAIQAIARQS